MADNASVRVKAVALLDEIDLAIGQPNVAAQIATITAARDAAVAANAPMLAAIQAAKAAAQAAKDADAASVEGQPVLDALSGF